MYLRNKAFISLSTFFSYDWFSELGLEWYAVPGVSNMMFDCGGIEYTAAPFNGWYMGTEVGSRDFCDESRYNVMQVSNFLKKIKS